MKKPISKLSLISLFCLWAGLSLLPPGLAQTSGKRLLNLDDQARIRTVSEPHISPDGAWVAYAVESVDQKEDAYGSDIWMTSWDGQQTVRLTSSKERDSSPCWSPDGKYLSFLSSRQTPDGTDQIWLLNRMGGEPEQITTVKGAIGDYRWSPDGKRMVLVLEDPDPDAEESKDKAEKKTPKPIVIDRFQFKEDKSGYLTKKRQRLYLLELESRKIECLTPGAYNEYFPAWSPDGNSLVFVSKREQDFDRTDNFDLFVIDAKAGATPRRLTTFPGADCQPDWESHPAWSPDGKSIAYLQGGPSKLIFYAIHQLAVIPAAGGTPKLLAPTLDRNVAKPRWSPDGAFLYFLLEDDRNQVLAKVPAEGGKVVPVTAGGRTVNEFDLHPSGKIVVAEERGDVPAEAYAVEGSTVRPLSRQNQALLESVQLGTLEEISWKSKDGTTINGFVMKPPDFDPAKKYPTILRIHGGPVLQYSHYFNFDWHYYAAHGYLVLLGNPRGSSGRGEAFSKAIYADWGNKDVQDVLAGVDYLIAQKMADPARLGVGGWSYGGMLTNYTIASDTRFKAAISGAGMSNILAGYGTDQYIREYEAELGTPWANPETWIKISYPFFHADRIQTPTLFLCGDKDFNVPLLNSEQMYQALRSLGRDTQLVIYPGQFHEFKKPGYERDRLERYLNWYDKYLMPAHVESKSKP
ncbi:MAG: S9 family peptidase [Blastocatellia bacterium]|nr:S9 family peptidase [Blastocatellia bacterium]